MTATFTVLNRHGEVQGSGCTLRQAAEVVMNHDGHEFEIRPANDGKGFELWVSTFSRNSTAYNGLVKSVIYSFSDDRAEAEAKIYRNVIEHASWWNGCTVLTDAEYAAELAEIEADA